MMDPLKNIVPSLTMVWILRQQTWFSEQAITLLQTTNNLGKDFLLLLEKKLVINGIHTQPPNLDNSNF